MTALEVARLSKSYPLGQSQWARLKHVLKPGQHSAEGLWALRDVSFTVQRGEAFGVVGANGSGKSTLLQIIAGILQPTAGEVKVRGRLSALLELGSGFALEFSGRQNVYLNASILGLSSEEVAERFERMERFAGIGDFIDRPVRTYSTGMVLRLAFAVAAHVDPEILIVDEALAVGDIAFRQRCMRRIHELRAAGTTILFVSHESGDVKALCERCLWLEHGEVRGLGDADEVIAAYLSATLRRETARDSADRVLSTQTATEVARSVTGTRRYGDGSAEITGAELTQASGLHLPAWEAGASAVLRLSLRVHADIREPIAGFLIRNEKGETIFGSNTTRENYPLPEMQPGELHTVDFHWVLPELATGRYYVSVAVSQGTLEQFAVCDYVENAIVIETRAGARAVHGYLRLACSSLEIHADR